MIPKKLHLIWVGDQPKSELVLKCIESWKTHLPDYEIIEWGNEALSLIDNDYAKETFKCRKWAFLSDYLRLYALYHHGGIYLDSDVEITQSLDPFLSNQFFSGYELYDSQISPITAVMGAEPHNEIIHSLLKEYDDLHFYTPEKGMNLTTNTLRITEHFKNKFSLFPPYDGNQTTKLTEGSLIYPSYYFCTPESSKDNYSIHHFNGSWLDGYSRKNKLRFLDFSLVRFKRERAKSYILPLAFNETLIQKFSFFKGEKVYAIIKKNKND